MRTDISYIDCTYHEHQFNIPVSVVMFYLPYKVRNINLNSKMFQPLGQLIPGFLVFSLILGQSTDTKSLCQRQKTIEILFFHIHSMGQRWFWGKQQPNYMYVHVLLVPQNSLNNCVVNPISSCIVVPQI